MSTFHLVDKSTYIEKVLHSYRPIQKEINNPIYHFIKPPPTTIFSPNSSLGSTRTLLMPICPEIVRVILKTWTRMTQWKSSQSQSEATESLYEN